MYEKRDRAAQNYLREKVPNHLKLDNNVLEEIRQAFKSGWSARKKVEYEALYGIDDEPS